MRDIQLWALFGLAAISRARVVLQDDGRICQRYPTYERTP